MKRILLTLLASICLFVRAAAGDLDGFLHDLNVQARVDGDGFSARVSAQFGIPEARVKVVLGDVSEPADAFMVFQLGQMTRQSPEKVLEVYRAQKGKGWGVIAKELGIKPGSPEFHALKNGDFQLGGKAGEKAKAEEGGKGKGKGKNKPDK
jgi:hypothetical protein